MAIVAYFLSIVYPHVMKPGDTANIVIQMQQHSDLLSDYMHPDTFKLVMKDENGVQVDYKLIALINNQEATYSFLVTMPDTDHLTHTVELWFLDTITIPGILPELLMDRTEFTIKRGTATSIPTPDEKGDLGTGTDWTMILYLVIILVILILILQSGILVNVGGKK